MIKKILHQIWNERKENLWLFMELIVASIFLWLALDPLYTLVCRNNVPNGCDISNTYQIEFSKYIAQDIKFNPEYMDENAMHQCCTQAINTIRSMPEVQYHAITQYGSVPNSYSKAYGVFTADSTEPDFNGKSLKEIEQLIENKGIKETQLQFWEYFRTEYSNYPATFNIKDIHTGEFLKNDLSRYPNETYISESAAMKLFGTTDARGREFQNIYQRKKYNVAGVFKDIQTIQYDEPSSLIIFPLEPSDENFSYSYNGTTLFLHIRLKDGVDNNEFEKRFRNEIMPKLEIGNIYCSNITSHKKIKEKYARLFGISNKYRLYAGLSAFALFCAFLGLLSSFWIRTAERKNEIGVMRSMGASRRKIIKQFVVEALLLTSVAFIVAMPVILHYLYIDGFSDPLKELQFMNKESADPAYLHNQPLTHFFMVTAISYIFITIISIIGATIPAWRATRMMPADALRE